MSLIATAVKHLLAAGVTGDALVAAIAEMEASAACAVDPVAEKRRAYDRERKRAAKIASSTGIPPEYAETAELVPSLDKERSPRPPKEIKPIPRVIYPGEADPVQLIVDRWNGMAGRVGLSRIAKLTTERRRRVQARLAEHTSDDFTEAIAAVERSAFCRGDNDKGWRADFDFILQPTSFNRLIEGSYDRSPKQQSGNRAASRSGHGRTVDAGLDFVAGV